MNNWAKSPFELVHTDVWGPCQTASTLGFQYFFTFIDDYSRCTWLFLIKNQAKLFFIFQKFYAEIQTQFNISIRVLLWTLHFVSMHLPLEWRARFFYFEKNDFFDYLKMTWSRHLFLFYFLKGKQNKKEKP